jgi:hypothetical protein
MGPSVMLMREVPSRLLSEPVGCRTDIARFSTGAAEGRGKGLQVCVLALECVEMGDGRGEKERFECMAMLVREGARGTDDPGPFGSRGRWVCTSSSVVTWWCAERGKGNPNGGRAIQRCRRMVLFWKTHRDEHNGVVEPRDAEQALGEAEYRTPHRLCGRTTRPSHCKF